MLRNKVVAIAFFVLDVRGFASPKPVARAALPPMGAHEAACVRNASAALHAAADNALARFPWDAELLNQQADFDCAEAAAITDPELPVHQATRLELGFLFRAAMRVLKPYCRKDSDWYGEFCMAMDVESARIVAADSQLLAKLPELLSAASRALQAKRRVDLLAEADLIFPTDRLRAARAAGFVGLDDNGVQSDRLRALMARAGRWEDYVTLTALTANLLPHRGQAGPGVLDFARIQMATRMGWATLPGIPEGVRKTYKAYAGLAFGCELARAGEGERKTAFLARGAGAAYELSKLVAGHKRDASAAPLAAANQVGEMMAAGAAIGHARCL